MTESDLLNLEGPAAEHAGPEMRRLSFNTITNYGHDLREVVQLYARYGISHATLWRENVDAVGIANARRILSDHGIVPTGLCGWFDRDKSTVTTADKLRSVEVAAELGSPSVTLIVPGLDGFDGTVEDCRKHGFEQASTLLEFARECGVRVALEPINPKLVHRVSCLNSISQAIDWCEILGPGIGVELDVNNVWWDPDLYTQIDRAFDKELVCGVQLCDVPSGGGAERVVLGEGIVDLHSFVGHLEERGYTGLYEIELIGQSLWQRETDAYMHAILDACNNLLGNY